MGWYYGQEQTVTDGGSDLAECPQRYDHNGRGDEAEAKSGA